MEAVQRGKVVSATVNYSNENEKGREYNISADAVIAKDAAIALNSGKISKVADDAATGKIPAASFNIGQDGTYTSITFSNASVAQQLEMLNAIYAFFECVKANVAKDVSE